MPFTKRTCRQCGSDFELLPDKPGNINDCPGCSVETVNKKAAKVAWSGKHFVEIEIVDSMAEAHAFNAAQKRMGHFPNLKFTPNSIPFEKSPDSEASKRGSGAGIGDTYFSRLGERRSVR